MLRIGIVDDNEQMLDILSYDLTRNYEVEIIFTAKNGKDFLQKAGKLEELPEIVLMDVEMPRMDGVEAVRKGKEIFPEIKFIMLSVVDDEDVLFNAIKAGAEGYLLKEEPIDKMVEKLSEVNNNGAVPFSPAIATKVLNLAKWSIPPKNKDKHKELTDREKEVLTLLADGLNSNEIADKLYISFHTVRKHIRNIYSKLHVSSQAEAVKVGFLKRWLGF